MTTTCKNLIWLAAIKAATPTVATVANKALIAKHGVRLAKFAEENKRAGKKQFLALAEGAA